MKGPRYSIDKEGTQGASAADMGVGDESEIPKDIDLPPLFTRHKRSKQSNGKKGDPSVRSVLKRSLHQADQAAIALFISIVAVTIVFSGHLTDVFLLGLDPTSYDADLASRVQILIVIAIIVIAGAILQLTLTRYQLKYRTTNIAEAMVSDLTFSREQFRVLYENSPVPYFLMNDDGMVRSPNRATLRFFEGTEEECSILNFFSLIHVSPMEGSDPEIDMTPLLITKVERGLPITKQEMVVRTLSGSQKWVLASIYSLDRSSNVPYRHLVTLVDITKEKESETVKTDFLLLASHQLRTPITTIKWYIDYLLTSKSVEISDEVRGYLEQIFAGNERMIELITTLLTVSRIEMGTLAPEYTRMHLGELVDDVLKELEPDIGKKLIKIEKHIDEDDVLTTDRSMMRIAIHNLCTNAIKYTPSEGTVYIEASFTSGMCSLAVRDTGYGIPPSEQEKIFTKMFRASNARQISANGTGLGLHLTKAFIEKLGGTIDFSSELNKGTSFFIRLPRVAPDA